jgi:hypothetical protein
MKFGSLQIMESVSKKIYETDIIYKEGIENFGKLLNIIINGNTYKFYNINLLEEIFKY